MTSSLHHLCFFALSLLLVACSASEQIEKLNADYGKYYAQIPAFEALPVHRLTWQEALQKVETNNLEYRELQRQSENSRYQLGRTLRSLIPMLDAGYYYNAPLRWGEGEPTRGDFNINIFFNLPQLVQLPVERYTDALNIIKADTELKSKRRELSAQLYQIFREYELLRREEQLEEEKRLADDAAQKLVLEGFAEKKRLQWGKLCRLMNDYSARWEPDATGLPVIRLADFRRRAKAPDKLFMTNISLRAEAARLQKLGVLIRFMPTAQINFFSPSLFRASGGTMDGFMRNADDIRINLNSYITLDTKLENYHDFQDVRKGEELTKELQLQHIREHKDKMESVLRSWEQYEQWRLSLRDYVRFRNSQGVPDFEEAARRHQEALEIEQSLIEQQRANLERECAAIQEYGWQEESKEQANEVQR